MFEHLTDKLSYFHGNRSAEYKDHRIISAFQPIYSIAHRRIVGLEGLARGLDSSGKIIPPLTLFKNQKSENLDELDRICQLVHIENFHALNTPNSWLFLNVNPQTLNNSDDYIIFLNFLLSEKNYPANRIVIEVLESAIDDEKELEIHIKLYKKMGFLIAIDDFGAGQSNFERIWRIKPDIVKLDRSMIKKAGTDSSVKGLIKGISSMLHHSKCIVLAEGIETENEALVAMEAGVDLVQGFYFARPFLLSEPINSSDGLWRNLYRVFDDLASQTSKALHDVMTPYIKEMSATTLGPERKQSLAEIAQVLLPMHNTIRLYQLPLNGVQCSANIDSPTISQRTRGRLKALADTKGANWKRRDYFRNASQNPGVLQVTTPYFSISDGTLCITLSVQTKIGGEPCIICCDVLWDENDMLL
jgi:EAL domain-containing protein (putative c-di-GMP-specific phosphodiesterase class I)